MLYDSIMNSVSKRKIRQIVKQQFKKNFQKTLYEKVRKTTEINVVINKVRETKNQLGKDIERESTASSWKKCRKSFNEQDNVGKQEKKVGKEGIYK